MNTYTVLQISLIVFAITGSISVGWPLLLLPTWFKLFFVGMKALSDLGEKNKKKAVAEKMSQKLIESITERAKKENE